MFEKKIAAIRLIKTAFKMYASGELQKELEKKKRKSCPSRSSGSSSSTDNQSG